jgi:recombinational DNA repair ATPase RecF
MKLNRLHINCFRGATTPLTLNLSKNKNMTLIYGENGNGKSSIADALVCLCTEGIGSLDDKSTTDHSFLKSLDSKACDFLIELETDSQTFKATLASTSNNVIKNPSSGLPKLQALRRAQITKFIEEAPSERYKVLSSFIDVSNIQKSENELKKLISSLDREYGQNAKSLTDARKTLNEIWEKEGKPLNTLKDWIQEEIGKDYTKLNKEVIENNIVLQKWNTLQSTVSNIKKEKEKYDAALKNYNVAEGNLKKYQLENPDSEINLLSVLNETKSFLTSKSTIEKCPVCEKPNIKGQLLKSIDERILKMNELNKITRSIKETKEIKTGLYNRLHSQIEPFNNQITTLKAASILLANFDFLNLFKGIIEPDNTKEYYKEFSTINLSLTSEMDRLLKHYQSISKSVILQNSIKSNYNSIITLTKKCKEIEKLASHAKSALGILENTRKNHIDNELNSISGSVELMYQTIHPNEGLGNIKLFLNHTFQGSLNLTASFHSKTDITPQSLYSESHLDTLGICIFLALAKKDSNKDLILVLDDVIMSVDEKHLDRIINLIHSESQNFAHVFISTHYRPWRERYRNHRAPNSNIQFIELRGWSKERGISLAKPELMLNEIKYYLDTPENFHRENLAGASGRFLEALLDFLTYNFQCRLKRKTANDYTLSELLDGISSNLLKILKVQKMELLTNGQFSTTTYSEEIILKPTIDEIKNLKAVRNQVGAHFSFDGALVGDTDIEDFAKATIKLAELLICPVSGSLPDRNKSGSYWETKAGSVRLYPLIEP